MIDITRQEQAKAQRPEVDFAALKPGLAIGRYEIIAVLGQGGFGITYRARDAQLNRDVAIKEYLPSALAVRQGGTTVLPRSTRMSDDFTWGRQRFVDEGRTLATLQRAPAIVRVFDFLEANGTAYIVMELVPGQTLDDKLKAAGKLNASEIDRILWPLLDGLEQVHATGFLHRDIKPANILLDSTGNPTLIDFGASRAAMADRTTAMTAIFTPGYAAAEQMTSAKQGPWTDIYGLSATIYHAVTGTAPPSAFDRMLDDLYEPLAKLRPEGFAPGLLVGIDAGLTIRAGERPQSIAGWRAILGQAGGFDSRPTVALGRTVSSDATVVIREPATAPSGTGPSATTPPTPSPIRTPFLTRRRKRLLIGLAVLAILAIGRGGPWLANHGFRLPGQQAVATPAEPDKAAQAEDSKRQAMQQELDQLRKEKEAQEKTAAEDALKKKIEAETRASIEAEMAARQKAEEEARQKLAADETAHLKAQEQDRKTAEATESALRLSTVDRQHIQVALTALGFSTNGTDGFFGGHTRDMIAAWQKSRGYADTSFLSGAENQTLLRDAGPAIAKFDDDQRKAEQARPQSSQTAAARTPATPGSGPDGVWHGTYHCAAATHTGGSRHSGGGPGSAEFTMGVQIRIVGGSGTWVRPGSGPGTRGNQSLAVHVNGNHATVTRSYIPASTDGGTLFSGSIDAAYDGNAITGHGLETNSAGRICDISLTR